VKYWKTGLAILAALSASLVLADDFKTINGKEYKNAKVSRVEPDGIVLIYKSGVVKVFFVELPKDVQKRFGYDTDKIEAAASAAKEKRVVESHNAVSVSPTGGQSAADNTGIVILAGLVLLVVGAVLAVTYANAKSRATKKVIDEKLSNELPDHTEAAKKENRLPTVEKPAMKIRNEKGEWAEIPKLMLCPDCRKEVSVNAATCPHCGRKLKQEQTAIGLLAAIIIGLLIAGGLGLCSR
jgi:hypothetical protein